ncbi:MAG: Na/Pi cotransporter family protein [Leptospiraceae bacterium]|nr:Na/Pi cotransporter family protein [Leptospiraceae bacterium]
MGQIDLWKLLAGLGIFLFGMYTMEQSIRAVAGRSFKALIRRYTGTRWRGLFTGIVSTAALQSSSAVSLLVLAFVGAGIMSLVNAIAVMVGSNIGTTFTAWIVALFGFKIKIEAFALPMIGLGGLGTILFTRSDRFMNLSRLLIALGFLFHGLDLMKSAVESLSDGMNLAQLPDLGLWFFVLVGIVLTAAMQASAATIALVLTALHSGMIDFTHGAAVVIGANVGTTITILIGSIGGSAIKKQAALSHVAFNLFSAALAFALLPLIVWIIHDGLSMKSDVLGVALFHTVFNCLGAMVFMPFLGRFARLLSRIYPDRRLVLTRFIQNTDPTVFEAALVALRNEVLHQLFLSVFYIARKYRVENPDDPLEREYPAERVTYGGLSEMHAEIFGYYSRIPGMEGNPSEAVHLDQVLRASRSIMNATRNLRSTLTDVEDLLESDQPFFANAGEDFRDRLRQMQGEVSLVYSNPDSSRLPALREFFTAIEQGDKKFIASCSREIMQKSLSEEEVTHLLMINRLFTQSSRMLVLSMEGLVGMPGDSLPEHEAG